MNSTQHRSEGDVIWFVSLGKDKVRALTLEELDEAYQTGEIDEETLVRKDGTRDWAKLGDVAGIEKLEVVPLSRPAPPPLPPRASTAAAPAPPLPRKPASLPVVASVGEDEKIPGLKRWRDRLPKLNAKAMVETIKRRKWIVAGIGTAVVALVLAVVFIGRGNAASKPKAPVATAPAKPKPQAGVVVPAAMHKPVATPAKKPAVMPAKHTVAAKPAPAKVAPPAKKPVGKVANTKAVPAKKPVAAKPQTPAPKPTTPAKPATPAPKPTL
jgi:hypothetical protein